MKQEGSSTRIQVGLGGRFAYHAPRENNEQKLEQEGDWFHSSLSRLGWLVSSLHINWLCPLIRAAIQIVSDCEPVALFSHEIKAALAVSDSHLLVDYEAALKCLFEGRLVVVGKHILAPL